MPIMRHTYTTLNARVTGQLKGKFPINSGVTFDDVREEPNISGDATRGFSILYGFTTKYGEDLAQVEVKGEVLYVAPKEEGEAILKEWKESKRLPEKNVLEVGNYCLMRAQMKAIELANDLNLQSPVQLPKFEAKK